MAEMLAYILRAMRGENVYKKIKFSPNHAGPSSLGLASLRILKVKYLDHRLSINLDLKSGLSSLRDFVY